ncbi:calpain-9-like [Haliotis cracherodii]|uniref:calpain-9-like n=1 Tax=Haliotis cracherodii TaxID=6455 RepID=UPI0039E9AF9A
MAEGFPGEYENMTCRIRLLDINHEDEYINDPKDSGLMYRTIDYRKQKSHKPSVQQPLVRPGKLWTDPDFPLHVAIKEYNEKRLRWQRPHDIVPEPVLFAHGKQETRFDVKQNQFGTCWFLAMLANLPEKPELLKKVIKVYNPDQGICHCRLWRFGEWCDVYIDDHLPVQIIGRVKRIYGARSGTEENEMWVSLLEKALAKLYGSYNVVSDRGGFPVDAFLALTGGVAERISQNPSDVFYKRLTTALSTGAMVTCVVPKRYHGVWCLIGSHAYSLTGYCKARKFDGQYVPLLRIRDPHGTNEWKGPWSDGSPEWRTVLDKQRNHKQKDDGEFWICLDDFLQYFVQTAICALTPDFNEDGQPDPLNHVLKIFSEWQGDRAAGKGFSLNERLNNPRLAFTVRGICGMVMKTPKYKDLTREGYVPIVVQLVQKAEHLDYQSIRCDVFKMHSNGKCTQIHDTEGKDDYFQDLQCIFRYNLKEGNYFVVPSTENPRNEREFLVRLFSPCPLLECRFE